MVFTWGATDARRTFVGPGLELFAYDVLVDEDFDAMDLLETVFRAILLSFYFMNIHPIAPTTLFFILVQRV